MQLKEKKPVTTDEIKSILIAYEKDKKEQREDFDKAAREILVSKKKKWCCIL